MDASPTNNKADKEKESVPTIDVSKLSQADIQMLQDIADRMRQKSEK